MDTVKLKPDMPEGNNCPQCGTPLSAGALAGLCPACLLAQGAAEDSATEGRQPGFTPPAISELAPLFPQLEILELVGKGGMGAVYKTRQKELDRIVALKILPPGIGNDPAFAERFAREAKALAKLNHPGIVTLYEFGRAELPLGEDAQQRVPTGSLYFFLMEFVDGVNLRQLLHSSRVSPREALAIVPQICDALQFAHDQGIVHRDIKPENILLDRRGRVKVADFGLAKLVGTDAPLTPSLSPSDGERMAKPGVGTPVLTDAGKVMGTPNYMAPEQVEHPTEVDHRADIYALGVVFYQMLTGELPGQQLQPPSKKVHVDVRLDEVVLRALEKKPELRYQQASVLKTAVETISTTPPPATAPTAAAPQTGLASVPWQIWVVVALLATEGVGNLLSIPRQPVAAVWLAAKILFIAGLLLRWRAVFVLVLIVSVIHVIYFSLTVPLVGLLNQLVLILVASAYRFYFPLKGAAGQAQTQAAPSRIALLKAGGWIAWLLWLPVAGFGAFFLYALLSERGGWHPNPTEAVVVPLVWLGSLLLPVLGWFLFRTARRLAGPSVSPGGLGFAAGALGVAIAALVLVTVAVGLYATARSRQAAVAAQHAEAAARELQSLAEAAARRLPVFFGPMTERIITVGEVGADGLIFVNLETAEVLPPPFHLKVNPSDPELFARTAQIEEWIAGSGADLALHLKATNWAFTPLGTQLMYNQKDIAADDFFAELSPAKAEAILTNLKARGDYVASLGGGVSAYPVSANYVFKTRQGNLGLLRLGGFTNEVNGVKLNFRIATKTNSAASGSKRQRFVPQPGMAERTSWTVLDKPSVFNPQGWAIMARMSLDGVVPARRPGETNEFCRLRMTKGNDDHITLKIEDVAAGSEVTVTLNRDERAEILVNGQGYRVAYLSAQVALDQPDTAPFAMISVTQVREDGSSGPGEESKTRPIPADAAVALREWGDYVRSKTVRELTDPEVAKELVARQERLAKLLRGTTAEPLWDQLEQAGTAARKAYSAGDAQEYQRWLKVQESLGEQLKALTVKTVTLARATNRLVGASGEVRTVGVWTDSTIHPGETFSALVKQADGQLVDRGSTLFVNWQPDRMTTSSSFIWWFGGGYTPGFGHDEAEAAVTQLRDNWTEKPIDLIHDKPLEVFSVTNKSGGIMVGYLGFKRVVPMPQTEPGRPEAKAQAIVNIRRFQTFTPTLNYDVKLPSGYALRAIANRGQVHTMVAKAPPTMGEYRSTWMDYGLPRPIRSLPGQAAPLSLPPPPRFDSPAQRQAQSAALEAQFQELLDQGPIPVVLGEARLVFSVTNGANEVYQGFLELVGPPSQTDN